MTRRQVTAPILAAGCVVLRKDKVLLVHRPRYDDWSFPKGKLDRGEHATTAAVREVAEETGLTVRLGAPLTDQHYRLLKRGETRDKVVHYWIGRVTDDPDVSGYVPNDEIDEVAWVSVDKAVRLLTYDHDRATLEEALADPHKTRTLVVLRHARARARSRWRADDRFRTLLKTGLHQADQLVPILGAYDVTTLVSSSSTRCVTTLIPYADTRGVKIASEAGLSEEEATDDSVEDVVRRLLTARRAVVCTHRPVLPQVWEALGLEDIKLDPGHAVVLHHRKGRFVAFESIDLR